MTISLLRARVARVAGANRLPVAIRDAVRDVLTTHQHAEARSRLRDIVAALKADAEHPQLVHEFEQILKEETDV